MSFGGTDGISPSMEGDDTKVRAMAAAATAASTIPEQELILQYF